MNVDFFVGNRKRLVSSLHATTPIVLSAYQAMQFSNDSSAPFRQESNFWWLTGIEEPGWWVIIEPDDQNGRTILVRPEISETHKIFDGSLSDQKALQISGADTVITPREARKKLTELSLTYKKVSTIGRHPHHAFFDFVENPAPASMVRRLKKLFAGVDDIRLELAQLRAIKQPEEIAAIRRAVDVTIDAFKNAHRGIADGTLTTEYELEAEFTYLFKRSGNYNHAYEPIVAGGDHACTLHYNQNASPLARGLVLLDVGAAVDGYAADITRTYAVGEPSERERAVHAAVEAAHRDIIALLMPGLKVTTYLQKVDEIMQKALHSLDLLKTESDYRKYFPHAVSHGLGVDVHDSLGAPETFQPGMVLTVEPGIYIPEEGIGVRIEDDILITDDGHDNLSAKLSTGL